MGVGNVDKKLAEIYGIQWPDVKLTQAREAGEDS
jgi:hypothetical protein